MNNMENKFNKNIKAIQKINKLKQDHFNEYGRELREIYFLPDLMSDPDYGLIKQKAIMEWQKRIEKYLTDNNCIRDGVDYSMGSCVVGAGISIAILRSLRHNYHEYIVIIRPPSRSQSSLTWEDSVDDIIKMLKTDGLDCCY